MTVGALDYSIAPVNHKFGSLITTNLSRVINCLLFGGKNAISSLCSASFHYPAIPAIGNDVVGLTCHKGYPSGEQEGLIFTEEKRRARLSCVHSFYTTAEQVAQPARFASLVQRFSIIPPTANQ